MHTTRTHTILVLQNVIYCFLPRCLPFPGIFNKQEQQRVAVGPENGGDIGVADILR